MFNCGTRHAATMINAQGHTKKMFGKLLKINVQDQAISGLRNA